MALEGKLKEKYGDELKEVDDVEELILDDISKIEKLTEADKKFLERFKTLSALSMSLMGLNSLENLPILPTLNFVFFVPHSTR